MDQRVPAELLVLAGAQALHKAEGCGGSDSAASRRGRAPPRSRKSCGAVARNDQAGDRGQPDRFHGSQSARAVGSALSSEFG
jgi:hypothetical protein